MLDVGGPLVRRGGDRAEDGHGDHGVAFGQTDAAHAGGVAAGEHPDLFRCKANAAAKRGGQQDVVDGGVAGADADDLVALVELHGDLAVAAYVHEVRQLVAAYATRSGGEHHVELIPGRLVLGQRQDRGDALAGLDGQEVDPGLAARGRRAHRQAPDLQLVDLAARREEQHRGVGVGGEDAGHRILFLGGHPRAAFAAAVLGPVDRQRRALHIAAVGDGDDHVLAGDQVLVLDVGIAFDDLRAARHGEGLADLHQLGADDGHDGLPRRQQGEVAGDRVSQGAGFAEDFVAPQAGEARQGQGQDRPRLLIRQPDQVLVDHQGARVGDQLDKRQHVARRPVLGDQPLARLRRVLGRADDVDELIDVGDRDRQADQDVAPVAGLREFELGPPDHHLLAEIHEGGDHVAQAHLQRPPTVQCQHVHAERGLQRGVAVELIEDHVGGGVALHLDDDAHALPVAFVAQVGNAFDPLFAHQFGDALDQPGLVQLVGDRVDDDRFAVLADLLDGRHAAHDYRAAAGHQRRARRRPADDLASGGEIGTGDDVEQGLEADLGIVNVGEARIDHFAQIVRRDVGGHADRNAAGAVDQQVGDTAGQHQRLVLGAVVVVLKVDRVFVEVRQDRHGRLGQPAFGVAHGRRRIVVHRPEVALPVDQQQAHGERLGHPHQGVVDRQVPVRVVLAHHIADHAGRLDVGAIGRVPLLAHREQDAPVHGLQAVAHIGQGPAHDHAHGVVEIRALQLVFDRDRGDAPFARGRRGGVFVGQGRDLAVRIGLLK